MQSATARTKGLAAYHDRRHSHPPIYRSDHSPVAAAIHTVLLTPVLQNRRLTFLLVLAAVLQTGFAAAGLSAWTCPFYAVFSKPCPACGMTSGSVLLLQGQWEPALRAHLFSPLILTGTVAAGFLALMPTPIHRRILDRVEALERSTGLSVWIGFCLGVYWICRLAGGI